MNYRPEFSRTSLHKEVDIGRQVLKRRNDNGTVTKLSRFFNDSEHIFSHTTSFVAELHRTDRAGRGREGGSHSLCLEQILRSSGHYRLRWG